MKVITVCGSGLGSSFMLEMNIKKVLKELGIKAEVGHREVGKVKPEDADIFVMSKSFDEKVDVPRKVLLSNIISLEEVREKLSEELKK